MKKLSYLITLCLFAFYAQAKESNSTTNDHFSFVENKGQVTDQNFNSRKDVDFKLPTAGGLNIFIGDGAIHYQFLKPQKEVKPMPPRDIIGHEDELSETVLYDAYRLDVELVGANKDAEIIREEQNEYYEMYYVGNAGINGWRANTYSKITYADIYPNIDWVLYSHNGQLKHEFVVKQGGKLSDIRLKYSGASNLAINTNGSISATTPMGTITDAAPVAFTKQGADVACVYQLDGDILTYNAANYTGELVIDPNIEWGTYYAGLNNDYIKDVAGEANGTTYSVGQTNSGSNIVSASPHQTTFGGNYDAFIVKLLPDGSRSWATYYGGTNYDRGYGIALDGTGNLYIVGYTNSTNNMATSGSLNGGYDGFLAKFNTSGVRSWGKYVGAAGGTEVLYGAYATANMVAVCGYSGSSTGIGTAGAHQLSNKGSNDAIIVAYNDAGILQFGTYLGGTADDYAQDVTIDNQGNTIVVGNTYSNADIASNGSYQSVFGGNQDALIASFDNIGKRNWSTYYGGPDVDNLYGIAIDGNGNICVAGSTNSYSDISIGSVHQFNRAGDYDGMIIQLNSGGTPQWATYYGGTDYDVLYNIAVSGNNILVCGTSKSTNGIATSGVHQSANAGNYDGIMAAFTNTGTRDWGTYYGGTDDENMRGLVADQDGNIYAVGETKSSSGIATPGALISTYVSGYYGFVARFCNNPVIGKQPDDIAVDAGKQAKLTVTATGGALAYQWQTDMGTGFQNITNSGQYSGVTTATLTVNNTTLSNNNQKFRCILTSGACTTNTFDRTLFVFPTGIDNIDGATTTIYPNPADDEIVIIAAETINKIDIYNLTGRKVHAQTANSRQVRMNIQDLAAGMYIIRINDIQVSKITKQ